MMGLYTSGLIFEWAYIWNALSVSTMVGLCTGVKNGGGGGWAYSRRFTVFLYGPLASGTATSMNTMKSIRVEKK